MSKSDFDGFFAECTAAKLREDSPGQFVLRLTQSAIDDQNVRDVRKLLSEIPHPPHGAKQHFIADFSGIVKTENVDSLLFAINDFASQRSVDVILCAMEQPVSQIAKSLIDGQDIAGFRIADTIIDARAMLRGGRSEGSWSQAVGSQ